MKDYLITALKAQALELAPEVVALRRDLHRHPELAFEEVRTAGVVAQTLTDMGLAPQTGIAKTGVVALLQGTAPGAESGPTLALRADMDALPITEQTGADYASTTLGKMHACGHDAHTASLLGTARLLMQHRQHLRGTVKFIFQPSEEKLPGGASVMIAEGVLRQPDVQAIVGQHVMPWLPAGTVGIRSGQYMASTDELYFTIRGKGGHGAMPHLAIDPVTIAAQLILALQQVVSRRLDPRQPAVLTIGRVEALGATNVIPEEVTMQGTFRAFDEATRAQAHQLTEEITQGLVRSMGGEVSLEIRRGYPVLHNDEALTARVRTDLEAFLGPENVKDLDLWPAAEDFAYYTQQVPGCFYRLGTGFTDPTANYGLHHSRFNIDEAALAHSTGLMAWLAISHLAAA